MATTRASVCTESRSWDFRLGCAKTERSPLIRFHPFPHLDELVAAFLIEQEATDEFLDRYCRDGEPLNLGIDGGPFDEHPRDGELRKEGCAATLVAEALGVGKEPHYGRLINYARFTDIGEPRDQQRARPEERTHPFGLNDVVKRRWQLLRDSSESLGEEQVREQLCSIFFDFEAEVVNQRLLHEARKEISRIGRWGGIDRGNKMKPIKILLITSGNPQTNAAARIFHQADVVIQRQPKEAPKRAGCVNIFTSGEGIHLDGVAQMVLLLEQDHMVDSGDLDHADRMEKWDVLRREGKSPCGRWYYFRPHGQLHNGTDSYEDVPSTQLTDDELMSCITTGLSTPSCPPSCPADSCAGPRGCDYYRFGFWPCRRLRSQHHRGK